MRGSVKKISTWITSAGDLEDSAFSSATGDSTALSSMSKVVWRCVVVVLMESSLGKASPAENRFRSRGEGRAAARRPSSKDAEGKDAGAWRLCLRESHHAIAEEQERGDYFSTIAGGSL